MFLIVCMPMMFSSTALSSKPSDMNGITSLPSRLPSKLNNLLQLNSAKTETRVIAPDTTAALIMQHLGHVLGPPP